MLGEPLDLRRPKTSSKAAPRTGPRSSQPRATAAEGGTPPARSGPKLRFDRRAGGVFLRADSLVRVRFDDELHSGRHRRGRKFGYTLLEDVVHDGAVVLAKGSRGQGQVTGARRRGRFGRSGRLDLDFGGLPLPGGGQLRLGLTETSREANKQTAIAAGSSGAGLLVLGPIGLAGGLFVKGRDAYIKEGDVTWVSVLEDAQVR